MTDSTPANMIKRPVMMKTIDTNHEGQRIDNFLMAEFRVLPKSRIYQMLRKGEVRVNKGRIKPTYRLNKGDIVRLPPVLLPKTETVIISEAEKQHILHCMIEETPDFIAINKASGDAVHAGSEIKAGVIEWLRAAKPECSFLELVHRLDRDTSGILLIAKNRKALLALQQAEIEKHYTLLVKGALKSSPLRVDLALDTEHRDAQRERHVTPDPDGKPSTTIFTELRRFSTMSLLDAELITGRTHQIRVHSAASGFPIIGDPRYGDTAMNREAKSYGIDRLFLHASLLKFTLNGANYTISAPLPKALNTVLSSLK